MSRRLSERQQATLEGLFGAQLLLAEADRRHYGADWSRGPDPDPVAVVRPETGEQLQALLRYAAEWHWPLVPSGGRTGLAGGARAANGEMVVSFERMNRILELDTVSGLLVCEPGAVTACVQQAAAAQGLYYPVEFAADGSSQIGGNVATNAGGVRVLRYGMTRRQVAGLAWLDAAGTAIDEMRCLHKDNAGPALRQLMIGSEGSLGLIIRVGLWLQPAPPPRATALIRLQEAAALPALMQALTAFELHACEWMDAAAWQLGQIEAGVPVSPPALAQLLVEAPAEQMTAEALAQALAGGPAAEVLLAQSQAQAGHFWAVREAITPALRPQAPLKFDLGFRLDRLPAVLAAINTQWPQAVVFGHLGDGNLHLNIPAPLDAAATEAAVYRLLAEHRGTLTAEHGIGRLRRAALHAQEAAGRLAWLRQVKRALDPQGLLNPGVWA